jgi:acetoacetate decarboxylase
MSRGTFVVDPTARYDMPVMFGPTTVPTVSTWGRFRAIDVNFVTSEEAVRPVVPAALEIPAKPVVTVSRRTFGEVDYLAGRGYEELCIGVSASHNDGDRERRGVFWLAMWVDHVAPITLGREVSGFAKLGGEFPEPVTVDDTTSYDVLEYGTRFITGSVSAMVPVDDTALEGLNRRASATIAFNIRHIPPIRGGEGIDQVTCCDTSSTFSRVERGVGSVKFEPPAWRDAPHSSRVIAFLASLPILEERPAAILEGHSSFDRSTVTAIGLTRAAS